MYDMDNGKILREKMLGTFGSMLRPARIILNMSREELAAKTGLHLETIAGVEDGFHRFHERHYLAIASVFDYMKFTEEGNIYKALVRILTPDGEFVSASEGCADDDFILVKRWFATFGDAGTYDGENYNEEDDDENYDEYDDEENEDDAISNFERSSRLGL